MIHQTRGMIGRVRGMIGASLVLLSASAVTVVGGVSSIDGTRQPIKLGMSTALTGPASDLGRNMMMGVEAAIEEINASGGIQGRPIELIALDDGYEPERTIPNMHQLIQGEGVVAVIGNVGTPTAVAAIPIVNESKTPLFGAYTGAGVLRKDPPDRYVINYRASYAQETSEMVSALIEHAGIRPEEIAFFTQQDAYGDAGYEGGMLALRAHGLAEDATIMHGRYARNTLAVENGLADIMQAPVPCKAIIMVGSYAPCAAFIRLAREVGVDAIFCNVSFVGSASLASELDGVDARVIISQVVPHPEHESELVGAYRSALRALDPDSAPTYGSLEGYLAMTVFGRALGTIEGPITRESVVEALESMGSFELDAGLMMSLSARDHQASDRVWGSAIEGDSVVPIEWSALSGFTVVAHEESADE